MTASFHLPPNPLITSLNNKHHKHNTSLTFLPLSKPISKPITTLCFSSPSDSDSFWLREEQRWLREEQRWLREEQRWLRERESLLAQIHSLNLRIQALESSIEGEEEENVVDTSAEVENVNALLKVLQERNLLVSAESGGSVENVTTAESGASVGPVAAEEKEKGRVLRKGSEGEEVRLMQEALQALGFYSGEEDMEFSSFSSGTERAVKTWQATLGASEDGIMTLELLERLYTEQRIKKAGFNIVTDEKGSSLDAPSKENGNGSAVASVAKVSETQEKFVKDSGTELEISEKRVFLIGENRWEEPSRLTGRDKQVKASAPKDAKTYCLTCRGEGRLMCTECDGTGEPNIEPQFLEWIGEDAKCAYCEGLGYITCDVCEGKTQ